MLPANSSVINQLPEGGARAVSTRVAARAGSRNASGDQPRVGKSPYAQKVNGRARCELSLSDSVQGSTDAARPDVAPRGLGPATRARITPPPWRFARRTLDRQATYCANHGDRAVASWRESGLRSAVIGSSLRRDSDVVRSHGRSSQNRAPLHRPCVGELHHGDQKNDDGHD